MTPVVGLTAYGTRARWGGVWDTETVLLTRTYVDMVAAAGGAPVLLPPVPGAAAAVDRIDAVILSGGPDVAPERYGCAPHPLAGPPDRERDAVELAVLERALARDVPVLGVCRGAQLLNVALGGTLVQHVPDAVGHDGHNPTPGVFARTAVRLDPDSLVGSVVGPAVTVHCHHHQAVDRLATGLAVAGRAGDGTVEAVELTGRRFVVGVQWHPEQDAADERLFRALVTATRQDGGVG